MPDWSALVRALAGTKPQLGGAAGQAQQAISGRAYQLYAQEQQAQGLPAVPPEAYAQGQR